MLDIYNACCMNVKEIKKRAKNIKRMINNAILNKRNEEIITLTKVYALVYSAFVEVSFIKLINTPYGFDEEKIKVIQSKSNLEEKWLTCINLAFLTIKKESNITDINNKKLKLKKILKEYIVKPSELRNKIAHGQWKVALNNQCTNQNYEITQIIENIDFVKIDILFQVYDKFQQCIEDLIESPQKAHYEYFYTNLSKLEAYISKTEKWNFESRKNKILTRNHSKKQ